MTYVVTQACIGNKHTDCVDVCPVDAFREGPDMLYIDPEGCIDCNACLIQCPERAIYPLSAVPKDMVSFIELNARKAIVSPAITESRSKEQRSASANDMPFSLAVVGSGPAGFYAVEELLRQLPAARIDIFERLPTPFGLVRYGVAPDHPRIKSVAENFEKIAEHPRVRFFGNVNIGQDIQRNTLLQHYHAVIYATENSVSHELGIPGSDVDNVFGAAEFVGWYNGHPYHSELPVDLSASVAVVIGMGNVALDIARILVLPPDELAKTDISRVALEKIREGSIGEVRIIARRGPAQAAFTPGELEQLSSIPGLDFVIDANDLVLDAETETRLEEADFIEARQNVDLLRELASRPRCGGTKIHFEFRAAPRQLVEKEGKLKSLTGVRTELVSDDSGQVRAVAIDQRFEFEAGLIVNATGYRGQSIEGVPFDPESGLIPNENGRIIGSGSAGEPVDQAGYSKEFVAGWIKRGASGVIGSNKQCASETVARLLDALPDEVPPLTGDDVEEYLRLQGISWVSHADWKLLDKYELAEGRRHGCIRKKVTTVSGMLEVIERERKIEGSRTQGAESESLADTISAKRQETSTHFRTCSLCEAMCGLKIEYRNDEIISIAGDEKDSFSRGHICPKGYAIQDLHNDPDRLKSPIMKVGDCWLPVSWEEALDTVARRLVKIQKNHGDDAVAVYWGNPLAHNFSLFTTMGPFRSVLESRNLFTASSLDQMPHQLVSYLMYGHSLLFNIPDIDRTDYMLILGANPAASNGSIMSSGDVLRRLNGIKERGGKFVLIDPRRTETALYATEHQFIRPGTDALFLLGLIQVVIGKNLTRPAHLLPLADDWDELAGLFGFIGLAEISRLTGIGTDTIERIAVEFASAERAVCYGRMGVSTQEFGALCHWLIQILNILTGNLDRAGGMMFTTPALEVVEESSRGSFDRYRSRVRACPEFGGEFPTAILAEEILTPGEGQVRAFMSVAGNPVLSSPNGRQLDKALSQLDFMVSVDFYLNETTRHADIILPPTGPLEHEHYDLVFNLVAVRNVAKYSPALFPAAEGSRSDRQVFIGLIQRMRKLKQAGKNHRSLLKRLKNKVGELLEEHLSTERMLDLGLRSGPYGAGLNLLQILNPFNLNKLTLRKLKKHPHGMDLGALKPVIPGRLFTPDKKIQLCPKVLVDDLNRLRLQVSRSGDEADLLLIGRRDLRSNNSWLHNSYRLVKGKDRCALYVHPGDAARHRIGDRGKARIVSRVGELEVDVVITEDVMPGVVSLPHGWGHGRPGIKQDVAQANPGVSLNDLTDDRVLDELSGNAVLNGVPVKIYPSDGGR